MKAVFINSAQKNAFKKKLSGENLKYFKWFVELLTRPWLPVNNGKIELAASHSRDTTLTVKCYVSLLWVLHVRLRKQPIAGNHVSLVANTYTPLYTHIDEKSISTRLKYKKKFSSFLTRPVLQPFVNYFVFSFLSC